MTDPFRRALAASRALALAAVAGLLLAPAAGAAPAPGLYGATGVLAPAPGSADDRTPPSSLYRIDPDTGAATSVGSIGYPVTGLALDPTSGTLYGVTASVESSGVARQLLRLDDRTGAGTVVGSLGDDDISFNSGGDLYGFNTATNALAVINKATGAVTSLGDSGVSETHGGALAFDPGNTLWGVVDLDYGHLWTFDTATGRATQVARLSGSPNRTGGAGMNAAAFGCGGGALYSIVNDFGDAPSYLVTVDQARGEIATRGADTSGGPIALDALEWVCAAPPPPAAPANVRCGNQILGTAASERLTGTARGDLITGFAGADVIDGLGGDDCINGLGGNDVLSGGTGVDVVDGAKGNDRISGGSGRNLLRGGTGADRVTGGASRDVLQGNTGNDRLSGGAAADELFGGPGRGPII